VAYSGYLDYVKPVLGHWNHEFIPT
jgi:hypothetical protein